MDARKLGRGELIGDFQPLFTLTLFPTLHHGGVRETPRVQ
jgi:hypothetical protein